MSMDTDRIMAAAGLIRDRFPAFRPRLALVMGSGWRDVASAFRVRHALEYASIPELGAPQVEGHGGQLLMAELYGLSLLVFAGRRHGYEGAGWEPVAFPVCLAKVMGAEGIVLTNSAGGINTGFKVGTVMLIRDHINLMGTHPLIGPHHPFWGARFADMTTVYDPDYGGRFIRAASQAGVCLEQGVYLAVTGPSYETPAEIKAFRALGADAVGMSTVPEAILAHAAGLKVAGLSCITNAAAGQGQALSHDEVLAGARAVVPKLTLLLQEFIRTSGGAP